jgi:hypothetical protein
MNRLSWRLCPSTSIVLIVCLLALVAFIPSIDTPAFAASDSIHRTYYVDCAQGNDAASGGSPSSAWRTFAKVDSVTLRAGDTILFRRSVTCHGVFEPHGSGTLTLPIVVGSYGTGARPVLDGGGARAAVVLRNVQGWVLRGLAISDPGPTSALGSLRTGIEVLNDRLAMARGFTIENVDISDVDSNPIAPSGTSYANYSKVAGGIEFTCDPNNGFSCSSGHGFDGVLIAHNEITNVSREGMFIFGTVPTRNLVIRSNVLRNIGGDGIVADDSVRALIEKNVVNRFNVAGAEANAGIWAYDSTGDIFEFNDVSHGEHGPLDGMAYDIDGEDKNLLLQYNLSSDNSGGFIMVCNSTSVPANSAGGSVVRYNISQNDYAVDGRGIIDAPIFCQGEQNISVYNNTIYTTNPLAATMFENGNHSTVHFSNNIFAGPAPTARLSDQVSTFGHNLYFDVSCSLSRPDSHPVIANPDLLNPAAPLSGGHALGFRLGTRSPALGAGVEVRDNGGRDFFGHSVSADGQVDIGAYQGRGIPGPSSANRGRAPGSRQSRRSSPLTW